MHLLLGWRKTFSFSRMCLTQRLLADAGLLLLARGSVLYEGNLNQLTFHSRQRAQR